MRVLVIASEEASARDVLAGLSAARAEGRLAAAAPEAELEAFRPDAAVLVRPSLGPDDLALLSSLGDRVAVAVFVGASAPQAARAALEAGAAAYVVDGLSPQRVPPVLEVALARFAMMRDLRAELARARSDLSARKTIEKAKGVLMRERGLDEDAAYRALRKLSMDSGRPLAAVAADFLAYAEVLKREGS